MSTVTHYHFHIKRFDPQAENAKPYVQQYTLAVPEHRQGMMVLEALNRIKEQDETLSYRRSCGQGVCGSDGIQMNGRNGLACMTPLNSLGGTTIKIGPLTGFPIIRDLIVDMSQFYKQYERSRPWLSGDEPTPAKERLQSPEERAKLDGLYECILCACCSSSCPSYWWNPEKFMGPAALLQAARFVMDSRDTDNTRLELFKDPYSLFRCRGIMNCVSVCPKGLNPTKAIGQIRQQLLKG